MSEEDDDTPDIREVRQTVSLSEYKRLKAQGVDVAPPQGSPLGNNSPALEFVDEAAEVPEEVWERFRDKGQVVDFPDEYFDITRDSRPLDPAPTFEFVSGQAGTGKTFLTKERARKYKGATLVATTGIAAINLGGSTINSLLRYFDTQELQKAYTEGWLKTRLRKLHEAGIRRIFLDEVSMLDARQLTCLVRALEEVNQETWDGEPLGLTLCGDFCQLPPVKAPFAFASPEWGKFEETRLTEVKRQTDKDFIQALNQVRAGKGQEAVDFFRPLFQKLTIDTFNGPTVMAKNDEVDRYNRLQLDKCQGRAVGFKSERDGKQRPEWKQIPEQLWLKLGAQVMILANRSLNGILQYVNGDIGTLVDVTQENAPVVELHRTGQTVMVAAVQREYKEPSESKKNPWEVVGWVKYMPLRLAYATTCHKSQGLSLDHVQVNILSHFFQSPSMLYVALSRARDSKGLRLVGSPEQFIKRCVVDPKVKGWL